MPTITFRPAGVTVDYCAGESIFDVGQRAKIAIETACVGKATCGLCRIKIVDGEAHLNAFTDDETRHLGNVYYLTKVRLSCQSRPTGGDVIVELAPKKKRHS